MWKGAGGTLFRASHMHDAIILSDLHLGAPNCQHGALSSFLGLLIDGSIATKKVILNGDVFDSIDFRRLPAAHWRILGLLRELSETLPVRWITGNHDSPREAFSSLLGIDMLEEYILRSGGRRLLVLHGHQFDEFIEKHALITHVADYAYRMLQIIDPSHSVARFAKKASKSFLRCTDKIRNEAATLALSRGLDGVICGHTHRAMTEEDGEFGYYNSGCWTENPCSWLAIDKGDVSLRFFDAKIVQSQVFQSAALKNSAELEKNPGGNHPEPGYVAV